MRVFLFAALCAVPAGGVAAQEAAFAAGFAGAYAQGVFLDADDTVRGCRAAAAVDAHRMVRIERREDGPPTLSLVSDLIFDVADIPGRLVVDGTPLPTEGSRIGPSWVMILGAQATAAIMRAGRVAIDYGELSIGLPGDGLAAAVAFAPRCRFG